jgi:hypothetical protein
MALLEFNILACTGFLDQIEIITVLLDITECSIVLERLKVPAFWQGPTPEGRREYDGVRCGPSEARPGNPGPGNPGPGNPGPGNPGTLALVSDATQKPVL